MKRFFFNVLCGIPVVYLVTALSLGGFNDALGIIAISIICTAGIGLIFWIPVCWASGLITLWIVKKVKSMISSEEPLQTPDQQSQPETAQSNPVGEWSAIADYLRKVQAKGGNIDTAKERLRGAGWEDIEIEHALELLPG